MAVVPCRQCETPVDENATICPTCGAPNPAQRTGPAPGGARVSGTGGGGRVVITGLDIPFGDLVVFIIKVMFAAIPAYIILFVIIGIIAAIFGGIFATLLPGVLEQSGAGIEGM